MPEMTSYEPGEPCWVELASPDVENSLRFYNGLFGWDSYTMADSRLGEYSMFTLGGVTGPQMAGMVPLADESLPADWICVFSVRDVAAAAATIREAGGEVQLEAAAYAHLGSVVLATDTEGAEFSLWEPYTVHGAAVVDEPNAMRQFELACQDLAAAERFYSHVLGWGSPAQFRGVTSDTCYEWRIAERRVASVVCSGGPLPGDDVTANWRPCFAVADCDATAAEAERLGGTVTYPCTDTAHGRYAALRDPTGASLSIVEQPH